MKEANKKIIVEREFLSTSQLAKLLKISRVAVLKRINRGAVKAVKVGPNFIIKKADIKHLLKNMR